MNEHNISISVQFSGNGKGEYLYLASSDAGIKVGDRIVVPTKMKDDGTVSMSIATCTQVHEGVEEGAAKPVIQRIDPVAVTLATEAVRSLEAGAA